MIKTSLVFTTPMETLQPSPKVKGLSPKQLAFANAILEGKTQANAYIIAYNKPSDYKIVLARSAGQKIFNSPQIQSYLRTQTKKAEKKAGLSLAERFQILANIATDENNSPDTRIRCIDVYNKMDGTNNQKIEVNATFSANSTKMSIKDKINALRQARELRKANETVEDVRPPKAETTLKGSEQASLVSSSKEEGKNESLPLIEIEAFVYDNEKTTQTNDKQKQTQ